MQNPEPSLFSREVRLKSRPTGVPTLENFEIVTVPVARPKAGEILVRNLWMTLDPYMRGRMDDVPSFIPPFEINRVMEGTAIGEVLESNTPDLQVGDHVTSFLGWREAFVAKGTEVQKLALIVPLSIAPLETYLSVLGTVGLTAYVGLFCIARLKPGERIFISGAAGGVGSVACALAKSIGCYVVGTAGSKEKCTWLEQEIGIDAAINYRDADLNGAVAKAFSEGIDVYFEGVGGEHLQVALNHMRTFGRIAFCGSISKYNESVSKPGPSNLQNIVHRRLRGEGFIVTDHLDQFANFHPIAAELIQKGKIKWQHTIHENISSAPQAFIDIFTGKSFGKSLLKLS